MKSETERALAAAEAARRAAHAVIVDPDCEPRCSAYHLVVAWESLARGTCLNGHFSGDIEDIGTWLPARLQAALGPRKIEALARTLPVLVAERARPPWVGRGFPLGRGEVQVHARRLGELIAMARAGAPARSVGRRTAVLAAAAVAVLLIALWPWWALRVQPWRGTYYARNDHSGPWQMRYDAAVDFDWGGDAPMGDMPADDFSVRWDTCLHVDVPTRATFRSISDDGSRVYVDGDLIVLNRTRGRTRSRSGEIQLGAGVHHVRVDYAEYSGDAHVHVHASFDDGPPEPIPASMLHAPRGPASQEDPCE